MQFFWKEKNSLTLCEKVIALNVIIGCVSLGCNNCNQAFTITGIAVEGFWPTLMKRYGSLMPDVTEQDICVYDLITLYVWWSKSFN